MLGGTFYINHHRRYRQHDKQIYRLPLLLCTAHTFCEFLVYSFWFVLYSFFLRLMNVIGTKTTQWWYVMVVFVVVAHLSPHTTYLCLLFSIVEKFMHSKLEQIEDKNKLYIIFSKCIFCPSLYTNDKWCCSYLPLSQRIRLHTIYIPSRSFQAALIISSSSSIFQI